MSSRECSPRICGVILNIINCLFDLNIIEKKQEPKEKDEKASDDMQVQELLFRRSEMFSQLVSLKLLRHTCVLSVCQEPNDQNPATGKNNEKVEEKKTKKEKEKEGEKSEEKEKPSNHAVAMETVVR